MKSNLAQILLNSKKEPDVSDQALCNSPHTQHFKRFLEYRMDANLPQHPCANKCTDFKGEQCKTCLVQELPSHKSFDVDFLPGDVVVLTKPCRTFYSNDLFEVKGEIAKQLWSVSFKNQLIIVTSNEIRPATTAEIQANRRLTEAEQAIAEVS